MDKIYRILVINPGSTSTKLSMFENETCLFTEDVFHDSSVLKKFPTINDQLDYRMEVVDKFLKDVDMVIVMVKHDEIKDNMDKLKGKVILDTQNICNQSEKVYKL